MKKEILKAHNSLTVKKGRPQYSPNVHELQHEIIKQIVHDFYAFEDGSRSRIRYKKLAKKYGCTADDIRNVIVNEDQKFKDDSGQDSGQAGGQDKT
jgi:Mor family transcriptional regulator